MAAPGAAEGVVVGVKGLTGDRPLDRDVLQGELVHHAVYVLDVAVEREVLVEAPARRDVVDDHPSDRVAAERVVPNAEVAASEPHVAHDDVVRIDVDALPTHADAITGRRLPVEGEIWMVDLDGRLERDEARDPEDYEARPFGLHGLAKRPRAAIGQAHDDVDLAASAASRDRAGPFG